jgi:hypothetical protein
MTTCAKFLSNVCSGRGNLDTVHPSRTFASNDGYCLSATNDKGRVWGAYLTKLTAAQFG